MAVLQGTVGPFKTAKAIMLEDMRKKGQTYRPQGGLASSQESDRPPTAVQAPFKRLGPAKQQKRPGGFGLICRLELAKR